jgi:hypothetical protein
LVGLSLAYIFKNLRIVLSSSNGLEELTSFYLVMTCIVRVFHGKKGEWGKRGGENMEMESRKWGGKKEDVTLLVVESRL